MTYLPSSIGHFHTRERAAVLHELQPLRRGSHERAAWCLDLAEELDGEHRATRLQEGVVRVVRVLLGHDVLGQVRLLGVVPFLRRPFADHEKNSGVKRLLPVSASTHSLWNRLPSPLAVDIMMTEPPRSATGSIAAHASSEFGRKASSSTTTRYADSPRAGSDCRRQ